MVMGRVVVKVKTHVLVNSCVLRTCIQTVKTCVLVVSCAPEIADNVAMKKCDAVMESEVMTS